MHNAFYNTSENVYNCLKIWEVIAIGVEEINALNEVYREMVDIVGYDNTMILYTHFKGQQVTFPIKLFKSECISELVKKQYDGTNAKKLARTYGYSERWIKELLRKEETK